MRSIHYRVLGPIEVIDDNGHPVIPPSTMVRGLLAALLAEPGRTVAIHRLIDALWNEPPDSAESNLRGYVTRLRRTLPAGIAQQLITRRGAGAGNGGGYGLRIHDGECDVDAFRRLMATGRGLAAAEQYQAAATAMRDAVQLWRGPAGDDLPDTWPLRTLAAGLNDERLAAVEDLAATDLLLGHGHTATSELTALVASEPTRERAWALLAQARHLTTGRAAGIRTIEHARSVLTTAIGPHRQVHLDRANQAIAEGNSRPTVSV